MNFLAEFRRQFATSLGVLNPEIDIPATVELIRPTQDPKFGDYQANCAMPLGKQLGKPPREVAQQLVDSLQLGDLCDKVEIAGPGFINLRLSDEAIRRGLAGAASDPERLGIAPVDPAKTIVIDYSAPNVAKPMHVGHIRSTVIGAALASVLRFLGHRVITDNHIGDWGTQFGMIIYGYKHFVDQESLDSAPVAELSRLYRLVNQLVEYHDTREHALPALDVKIAAARNELARAEVTAPLEEVKQIARELATAATSSPKEEQGKAKQQAKRLAQLKNQLRELEEERATLVAKIERVENDPLLAPLTKQHPRIGTAVLQETAKLHAGDPENLELWRQFLPPCLAEISATYRRLGVTFDHTLGESYYHDQLQGVVDDLVAKGLAEESHGAICVFNEGQDAPFIVRKQDGAFLYATTDLATIDYRLKTWNPHVILYVVDHRQSFHFEQLFATARKWGIDNIELHHVSFGTVLGEDGKPYKTRSGSTVGLMGLLDEAVERARAIADESKVLTSDEERQQVAERIGIGAIKYADLAHNRTSDYVFSYDKMLAMNGNTAAYQQYSYARVRGIFEKAGVTAAEALIGAESITLPTPYERALALAILQFSEALDRVAEDYRPNHLTAYLFELASRYAEFFQNCPVIKAETPELRASRLALCALTARTLEIGLGLLGIECVERM